MKQARMFCSTTLATLSLVLVFGCSSGDKDKEKKAEPVASTPAPQEEIDYTTIEFDKGEVRLSEVDRRHLDSLASKMREGGKQIDDIKILTWADREVPAGQEATNQDIILAKQRAESIKDYLENNLMAEEDIDFYNMAQRPEKYSAYMDKKGMGINQIFTQEGTTTEAEGQLSKALVVIEYDNAPLPSSI